MSRILRLELFWLLFAVCLSIIVVMPIKLITTYYPFYYENILFVIVFVTLMRMMILVSSSALALHVYVKVFFVLAGVSIVFYLFGRFEDFKNYIDNFGTIRFLGHLSDKRQQAMTLYVENEMLFFGIGSIVLSIIFPFFLVRSIWMWHNKGKHF